MRKLVLDHTAAETVELLYHLLEILIVVFHLDLRRPCHLGINARHTEAALRIIADFLALFEHYRIDHNPAEVMKILICIRKVGSVHYHDAKIHSDLRSGKTSSVSRREGLPHV